MKKLFLFLALTSCAATGSRGLASKPYWTLKLMVNGDRSCGTRSDKPEPFTVQISDKNSAILGVSILAASFDQLANSSFKLNAEEKNLLNAGKIKEAYAGAYTRTFLPPTPVMVRVRSGLKLVSFSHNIPLPELKDFQEWHTDVKAKLEGMKLQASTDNPYLLFGPVSRSGKAPNYSITFDPEETVVSAGAQNEAHDTTLCQLRTGAFNTDVQREADIAIHEFISVEKE